jgi:pyruvate, orthophosphate dikinase
MRALDEGNPMLGTRGVRLGLLHPEVYEMQARAIFRAIRAVRERTGHAPSVEVMIPLIAYPRELEIARALVERVASEEGAEGVKIGTMIELPRACLTAGAIAAEADFFSFGTNDLTQPGWASRATTSRAGSCRSTRTTGSSSAPPSGRSTPRAVGELVEIALERGRAAKPGLQAGVCGEHGGDPKSIRFFHAAGLDYVSCSPFRVPIARGAAAQAACG